MLTEIMKGDCHDCAGCMRAEKKKKKKKKNHDRALMPRNSSNFHTVCVSCWHGNAYYCHRFNVALKLTR